MMDVFLCINCVMVDVFCNDMSQVAIKIIDKTQLNPGSLQKVCLGLPLSCTTNVLCVCPLSVSYVCTENCIYVQYYLVFQLFREVRIMKYLDHPNIGKLHVNVFIS